METPVEPPIPGLAFRGKADDLLPILKFVRRMKGSKCKIMHGQMFDKAANLRAYQGELSPMTRKFWTNASPPPCGAAVGLNVSATRTDVIRRTKWRPAF